MPIGRLFISEGYAKQRLLAERFAHDLHAHRQVLNEAGRYGDSRDSSYVYG